MRKMVAAARVEPYPPPLFLSLEEENDMGYGLFRGIHLCPKL
jgi:hypothetical protein